MPPSADNDNLKVMLLATRELDETAEIVAEIVEQVSSSQAVGIVLWDSDLESFGDKYLFGSRKKELAKLTESFAEDADAPEKPIQEIDPQEYKVKIPKELEPVLCYRIELEGKLISCILIAGSEGEEAELAEKLGDFPFAAALHNGWQYKELERENERLRGQYEDMEDKVTMLEDQTRKLISDLMTRDSIRTRQVERDRLVYSISNVVRSSLNIQRVLETAVEQIGMTFVSSRCLILRAVETAEQLNVFEFTQPAIEASNELFFTEAGLRFAGQALERSVPHELDVEANSAGYDTTFLGLLGIRSGLIVPLVLRENTLGVMFLQNCVDAREWSIDDVSLIGALADNLSIAIENAELHQERERQAVTDGLTGVANRRSFNETFSREFERARRYGEPLSLVIIDLDFLKKINDTYGHQTGDEAIKAIGRMLRQSSRTIDLAARYGGEEFCLLLPNTEIDMAEQLADRLRRLINDVELEGPGRISASLGVASYPLHADEPDELFQRADEAMYVAKQTGRNRVCVAKRVVPPQSNGDSGPAQETTGPGTESSKLLT